MVIEYMKEKIRPHRSHFWSQNQDKVEMLCFTSVPVRCSLSAGPMEVLEQNLQIPGAEPLKGPVYGPRRPVGLIIWCPRFVRGLRLQITLYQSWACPFYQTADAPLSAPRTGVLILHSESFFLFCKKWPCLKLNRLLTHGRLLAFWTVSIIFSSKVLPHVRYF